MDTEGKFVYIGTLSAQIEDANFGVRDTTVETRFWVGLFVSRTESQHRSWKKNLCATSKKKVGAGGLNVLRNSPYFCSNGNILLDDEPSLRF